MKKSIIDKVEAEIEVSEAKNENQKKLKAIIIYIVVALVLLGEATVLGSQVYNRYVPKSQYKSAIASYEAGEMKDALITFEKLGDYQNSEYYCDLIYSENPLFRFDHCKVGDEMKFGKYNYEDVEWVVADVTEDTVIMISKYIIEARAYPGESWLSEFKNKGFSGKESELVEKVYILDAYNAAKYVEGKSFAKTKPTDHALSNKEYKKTTEYGYGWWMSTSASYTSKHRVASDNGTIGYEYEYDSAVCGVRPAISINLKESGVISSESAAILS